MNLDRLWLQFKLLVARRDYAAAVDARSQFERDVAVARELLDQQEIALRKEFVTLQGELYEMDHPATVEKRS